jgi:multidrug efflux pump subunit AcrA (membrane-fusion protein)
MFKPQILCAALIVAVVTGCDKPAPPTSQARPVRTVTVERGADGETVSLTGHIRAKDQANLAFRLDGRMIERPSMSAMSSRQDRSSPSSTPRSSRTG